MEILGWLAKHINNLETTKVVALACISVACLLPVGEVATVRFSAKENVQLNGEKGRPGIWGIEVGLWTRSWAFFLLEIRRLRHGSADLPFSFHNANGLQA